MVYAKDNDGNQIYDPAIGYEVDNGVVVYAKDQFGNEHYFIDVALNKGFYKTNQDGSFTYAKSNDKKEIYAKNQDNTEFYYRDTSDLANPHDIYAQDRFGIHSYAKDKDNNEIYATDKDGKEIYITIQTKEIYARDKDHNEKYAKYYSKDEYYVTTPKKPGQFYAKDRCGNEIYAKNHEKNEFYYADPTTGVTSYAKNRHRLKIYAKDKIGNEIYMDEPASAQDRYILNKAGDQVYAKGYLGNEIYQFHKTTNEVIFAHTAIGREVYAKDANGNEFYMGQKYAKDQRSDYYYAQDNRQREIYIKHPITNKEIYISDKYAKHYTLEADEIYAKDENNDDYYISNGSFAKGIDSKEKYPNITPTNHTKYAKDSVGNEIYPIWNGKQYVIGDKYAIQDGNQVYPLDDRDNEYYHQGKFAEMSDSTKYYAVNADNFILVPLHPVTKEPMLLTTGPKVEVAEISAKFSDYATTTVKLKPIQSTASFVPARTFSFNLHMIIAIVEFLIILVLLFFYVRK